MLLIVDYLSFAQKFSRKNKIFVDYWKLGLCKVQTCSKSFQLVFWCDLSENGFGDAS